MAEGPRDANLTIMRLPRHRGHASCAVAALVLAIAGCAASDTGSTGRRETTDSVNPDGITSIDSSGGRAAPPDDCTAVLNGDVVISAQSGTFQGTLSVELSTAIDGAEIRYTTNGQLPTATSSRYSGTPLSVTSTARLRAQAFVQGAAVGSPSAALYIARSIDATHDIALIVLAYYGSGA